MQTNRIPGSDKTFTTFLAPNDLRRKLIESVGTENAQLIFDGKRSVSATCGSGMTAGVLWLGLKLIEESTLVSLYDEVRPFIKTSLDNRLMFFAVLDWVRPTSGE